MIFYLGPLGDLRALPPIESDQTVDATADAPVGEHRSLSGSRTQDRLGPHRRVWQLNWVYLEVDDTDLIDALRRGHLGSPLWLLDPQRPNLAPAQIASAGSERGSADGWETQTGTPRWKPALLDPATRPDGVRPVGVIEWTRATAADDLSVGRAHPAQRAPTPPGGAPVAASSWARVVSDTAVELAVGIETWDQDGTAIPQFVLDPVTLTPGDPWVELPVTTEPTGPAASFAPYWSIAAAQPTCTVQVCGIRYGHGSTPPAPSSGGGSAQVFVREMPETYPGQDEISSSLTLVEA